MKPNGTGYLAGPMTGLPNFNYDAFNSATELLRGRGFSIHNPAEHFNGDQTLPRGVYIRNALMAVMVSDWIALLPGWEDSDGALLELHTAMSLNLPVYLYDPQTGWLREVEVDLEPVLALRPVVSPQRAALLERKNGVRSTAASCR